MSDLELVPGGRDQRVGPDEVRYESAEIALERKKTSIPSASELLESNIDMDLNPVGGPKYFDCLEYKWARGQVLGLIGGTSVGKSSVELDIIKSVLMSNPDQIGVIASLEMSTREVLDRWVKIIGRDKELSDRLFILDPYCSQTGHSRSLGVQDIYLFCENLKKETSMELAILAIDHVGLLDERIDTSIEPNFGNSVNHRKENKVVKVSLKKNCDYLKKLSIMLDTFVLVLSQTTKSKGIGNIPIYKDGAYGVSQYENICDYVITIWQPLIYVHAASDVKFTAYQYAKIRHLSSADPVTTNQPLLLVHDLKNGSYKPPNKLEMDVFRELHEQAEHMAKNIKKGQDAACYSVLNPDNNSVIIITDDPGNNELL